MYKLGVKFLGETQALCKNLMYKLGVKFLGETQAQSKLG
jgi:hypothetical protein